jgi:hypothetical protein
VNLNSEQEKELHHQTSILLHNPTAKATTFVAQTELQNQQLICKIKKHLVLHNRMDQNALKGIIVEQMKISHNEPDNITQIVKGFIKSKAAQN